MADYLSFSGALTAMINDVRSISKDTSREMTKTIKKSGGSILNEARRRASWSTRIPGSLKVGIQNTKNKPGIVITGRTSVAPHMRVYEFGSSGKGRKSTFRAPLFGNRNKWYTHRTRPFIVPAMRNGVDDFRADVLEAVERAYRSAGFK